MCSLTEQRKGWGPCWLYRAGDWLRIKYSWWLHKGRRSPKPVTPPRKTQIIQGMHPQAAGPRPLKGLKGLQRERANLLSSKPMCHLATRLFPAKSVWFSCFQTQTEDVCLPAPTLFGVWETYVSSLGEENILGLPLLHALSLFHI